LSVAGMRPAAVASMMIHIIKVVTRVAGATGSARRAPGGAGPGHGLALGPGPRTMRSAIPACNSAKTLMASGAWAPGRTCTTWTSVT